MRTNKYFLASFALASTSALSLPIDWNGKLGADTTVWDSYRQVDTQTDNTSSLPGSQEVKNNKGSNATARFQTYVFNLDPTIIINDAATIKGSITTGYGDGGNFGNDSQTLSSSSKNRSFGAVLYPYNLNTDRSLNLKKLYMELYADTATYIIGRHSFGFGLGAVYNEGKSVWDRFSSLRDGITMKINVGNFVLAPFYSKVSANNTLTRTSSVKEYGLSLLYTKPEKDTVFGILYQKKNGGGAQDSVVSDITTVNSTTGTTVNKTEVKVLDFYFKQKWGRFSIAGEIPLISGELGNMYSTNNTTAYNAKAFVFESNYEHSKNLSFDLNFGSVTGHNGVVDQFKAMYLNPNYQIANIMFRYNAQAVASPNDYSIFDSYITNAQYARFAVNVTSEKWRWMNALIYANANEVAENGKTAFNHTKNKKFTASQTQDKAMGFEIDSNLDYLWNNEITVGTALGYHIVGDYYKFTNDTTKSNSTKASYLVQFKAGIAF